MTDLAERPNPSRWADLFDLALPIIDAAFTNQHADDKPLWTLGGGTAIALRLAHRISDDVDLFIGGVDLRLFIPQRNERAAALGADMQFPGSYLKFILPMGEIDFLPGPLLTDDSFTTESFRGRPIALQTSEEVILKKIRYRSTSFKARDVFDLAAVAAHSTTLGAAMIQETKDRLPTLLTAIRRHDARSFETANIRVLPGYEKLLEKALTDADQFVTSLIEPPSGKKRDKVNDNGRGGPNTDGSVQAPSIENDASPPKPSTSSVRLPVTKAEIEAVIAHITRNGEVGGTERPDVNRHILDLLFIAGDRMKFEASSTGSEAPSQAVTGLAALSKLRDGFGRGTYRTLSMAYQAGDLKDDYGVLLDRAIEETAERSAILFRKASEPAQGASKNFEKIRDPKHNR